MEPPENSKPHRWQRMRDKTMHGVKDRARRTASAPETAAASTSGRLGAWAPKRPGNAKLPGQAQGSRLWVATLHGDAVAYGGGASFLKTDACSMTKAVAKAWAPWCACCACLYAAIAVALRVASAPAWALAAAYIACAAIVPLAWPMASAAASGACQWDAAEDLDAIDVAMCAPERIASADMAMAGAAASILLGVAGSLSQQPVLCGCMALLAMGALYGVCRAQAPLATREVYASALGEVVPSRQVQAGTGEPGQTKS